MNCYNHPTLPAVAQCVDCGKGLCTPCAKSHAVAICQSCNKRRRTKAIIYYAKYIAIYIVLFYIGYKLDFLHSKRSTTDTHFFSGYLLMAIFSGWQLINKIIGLRLFSADMTTWGIYWLLKTVASGFIGIFTAPFTILWNIFKLVQQIVRKA